MVARIFCYLDAEKAPTADDLDKNVEEFVWRNDLLVTAISREAGITDENDYIAMTVGDLVNLIEEGRQTAPTPLTHAGTFALTDAMNTEEVKATIDSISLINESENQDQQQESNRNKIKFRILSADLLESSAAIANKLNIITAEQYREVVGGDSDKITVAMTGKDFEERLVNAGLEKEVFLQCPIEDQYQDKYEEWWMKNRAHEKLGHDLSDQQNLEDLDEDTQKAIKKKSGMEQFLTIINNVKVLAECAPEQKLLFVKGLKYLNAPVLMVGDSIDDQRSLKEATVGLSLANACDVAKDNADLVVTENHISQVKAAIMWGRQIYMNIKKFLVFQFTINFVVVLTSLVGSAIGHPPLNVLQMLWLNLVMDILGAMALCTEPWAEGVVISRVKRTSDILTPAMWKLVFVQALFQSVVLIVLIFFYGAIAYEKNAPNLFTTPQRDHAGNATNRLKMDTFIFHTFLLMCIFNQLNSRNIDSVSLNPFQNIFNHWSFILIFIAEIAVQQAMVM